jgi:hypothetical protein
MHVRVCLLRTTQAQCSGLFITRGEQVVTQQSESGDKPVMSLFFSAGNCMHMLTKLLRTTHGSMSAMATDICIVQYIQYDIVSNCYLDLIISYSLALSPQ